MVTTGVIMAIVVTFRLNAAMVTLYYDYHGDASQQKRYLQSLFSFSLGMAVLNGTILTLFGDSIFQFVFKSDAIRFFPYGLTILAYALLSEVNECYYSYLKNEKNLRGYLTIILCQVLSMILFQFLLIIVFDKGVQGALLGMLLANVVTMGAILLMEKDLLTLRPDRSMIKGSLKFSMALIPYLLISWAIARGGKIVLERFDSLSQVGVFALLITLTNIIVLAAGAVVSGVRPFLFELFADNRTSNSTYDDNYKARVDYLTKLVIILPLLAVPVIVLVGSNISILTSKDSYLVIGEYVTFACLTIFLLVYAKLFYQQMIFAKRSDIVTRISFAVLLVLLIGFYFWVPDYKIWGVLSSMAIANFFMAVLFYCYGKISQPISYNLRLVFVLPIVFFSLLFAIEWLIVYYLDLSRALFGIIQFIVLVLIVLFTNRHIIGQYNTLFIQQS